MGTIQGTLQSGAKIGPPIEARFHVTFLQCAQECAHAIVTIGISTIVELITIQDISGKAAVFQTGIQTRYRLHQKNFLDPQVLAYRIRTDAR